MDGRDRHSCKLNDEVRWNEACSCESCMQGGWFEDGWGRRLEQRIYYQPSRTFEDSDPWTVERITWEEADAHHPRPP